MIVGGLLAQSGSILLGKRAPTRALAPDAWDVFGGHVKPGERIEEALVRELNEELGVHATCFSVVEIFNDPHVPDGPFVLFVVDDWEGVPHNNAPDEHTEIRWFSIGQLTGISLAHSEYAALFRRALSA